MIDDMGIFRTTIEVSAPPEGERHVLREVMVDTGSEYSWVPVVVAFAEPGDMTLLGATALQGMNLRVDFVRKQLVPAGPVPVAAAA